MNQPEQYAADVATGYPRPWELYQAQVWNVVGEKFEMLNIAGKIHDDDFENMRLFRRPNADGKIRKWQQERGAITIDRTLLAEVLEIAENNIKVVKQKCLDYCDTHTANECDKELATIARARAEMERRRG